MSFLAGVGILAQGLSLFSGIAGDKLEASLLAAQAKERADVDRFNATVAEQQAKHALEGSQADAGDFRRAQEARLAASRAVQAGSGFTLEGSPLLVNETALAEIEFGVQRIISGGRNEAAASRQQGTLLTRSAAAEDRNAKLAKQAGAIKALGTAARGFTNIASTLSTGNVKFE